MPNAIFGPLWDAPICDYAVGFPTPVGTPCAWCEVPIEEKDSGLITPPGQADDIADRLHWHRECFCARSLGGDLYAPTQPQGYGSPMANQRDKDGNPLELLAWVKLFEDFDYRVVAETTCGDQLVMTIWDGLDDGVGVAPMYSTAVRHSTGKWEELRRLFWPCTLADAQAQHAEIAAEINRQHEGAATEFEALCEASSLGAPRVTEAVQELPASIRAKLRKAESDRAGEV